VEVCRKIHQIKPDIVEVHGRPDKAQVAKIKKACDGALVALAGEFEQSELNDILETGVDILMVNKTLTCAEDMNKKASDYLQEMEIYEVDQFRVMTDF
jgi:3-keto-L-gulonate-6-phosphate decarboxylase